ncbi:hypothetical protein Syun_021553 [Stephania yunnanensis]|uniref:Uncharacterized protein n=1 Tax=Stephania yunnanensis TaxID=152371 RepID=A0AAP0IFU9_9MAGN
MVLLFTNHFQFFTYHIFTSLQNHFHLSKPIFTANPPPPPETLRDHRRDSPRPPPETRRTAAAPSLLVSVAAPQIARKARSAAEATRRRRFLRQAVAAAVGRLEPLLCWSNPRHAAAGWTLAAQPAGQSRAAAGRSCTAFRAPCTALARSLRRHPRGRIAPSQLEGYLSRRPPPHPLRNIHRRWLGPPPPLLGPTPLPLVAQASVCIFLISSLFTSVDVAVDH